MFLNFFKSGAKHRGAGKNKHTELLRAVHNAKGEVMAAIDDLKKAVSDISTRVGAAVDEITALKSTVADLQAAIAASPNTDADVKAAADALQDLVGKINAVTVGATIPPAGS